MNRRTLFQAICALLAPWSPSPKTSIVNGAIVITGVGSAEEIAARLPEVMADHFESELSFTLAMDPEVVDGRSPKEVLDALQCLLENPVYLRTELAAGSGA